MIGVILSRLTCTPAGVRIDCQFHCWYPDDGGDVHGDLFERCIFVIRIVSEDREMVRVDIRFGSPTKI